MRLARSTQQNCIKGARKERVDTKIGERQHDISYPTLRTLTVFRHEVKNYLVWITKGGVVQQHEVGLEKPLAEQADKDLLWRREGKRLGEDRIVQWDFVGAPPSQELAEYLQARRIPYVVYQRKQ